MPANGPGPIPANSTMRDPESAPATSLYPYRSDPALGMLFAQFVGERRQLLRRRWKILGWASLPIGITNQPLKKFARGLPRKLLHEIDAARNLDVAEICAGEGQHLVRQLGAGRNAGRRLHDRHYLLPHFLMRRADDGDVSDLGMTHQQVLDFLRIDVHAPGNNHEALAVGEIEVALLVPPAHIAQRHPAVLVIDVGCLLRIIVIADW